MSETLESTVRHHAPTTQSRDASEGWLIRVEDLSVSFGNRKGPRVQAADGVKLTIYPGQTVAVVGESGSGKSVSAMSILQLIPTPPGRYDGGHIWWRGQAAASGGTDKRPLVSGTQQDAPPPTDLLTQTDRQMRKVRGNDIAMIFQEPMTSLNPVYSIGDQVLEAILLHQKVGRSEAIRIAETALRDVGIADPKARLREYPHQLSGGMRQRVMIAMALACQPRLLLADEPTTALDVTIQAQIPELLRRLQRQRDMAVMLITHDLGVVAENADVVAVMFAGRIVELTDVRSLFARPLHPYTRGLLRSMPRLGQRVDRLDTVMDGADVPEDFPAGWSVQPHQLQVPAGERYGGAEAQLHEVEPNHWVLCTPAAGSTAPPPRFPQLAYLRDQASQGVTAVG
jgi:ABC-type dipeptide/oligopeptide/nickel transport system ATPase component